MSSFITNPDLSSPEPPEDLVLGAVTVGSPHSFNPIAYDQKANPALIFMHLLQLLGATIQQPDGLVDQTHTAAYAEIESDEMLKILPSQLELLSNMILNWKLPHTAQGGKRLTTYDRIEVLSWGDYLDSQNENNPFTLLKFQGYHEVVPKRTVQKMNKYEENQTIGYQQLMLF